MSVEVERLIATLEARVDKFEKALVKSYQKSDENFGKIERRATQMTGRLEASMAAAGKKAISFGASIAGGFLGGFAAGSITQVVASIGQVASSVAAVGDEARRAGVDVESFQELKYVAEQNRIGVDALTDGLKELNLRADEFIVTGGGSAAEAFKRLGYTAGELNSKLQDPSALFTEIIGKLGQLDQAAQIRIADELFGGTGGEQFVQLIAQGEEGIARTIEQARELGVVMSQDLIDKAVDLDQKFNAVSNTVGAALKTAIVEASNALGVFLDQFRSVEERTYIRPLQNELAGVYERRFALQDEIANLEAEIAEMGDWNPFRGGRQAQLDLLKSDLDGLTAQADRLLSRVTELQGRGTTPPPITPTIPTVPGSGATKGPTAAEREADRQAKAIQNLIAGLEFERQLIGLTALEQEKLTNLRKADVDAASEQGKQISYLTEQLYARRTAAQQMEDIWRAIGDAGRLAFEGIVDAMADGKIEGEELQQILGSIAKQVGSLLLNQGLTSLFGGGSGGGGGLLATLFGGKRESGGPVSAGKAYIVGEKRPELFVPTQSGTILPQVPSGPSMSFPFAPVIDARGADQGAVDRLMRAMARQHSEFEARAKDFIRTYGRKWK